jgi:hypothetical protein
MEDDSIPSTLKSSKVFGPLGIPPEEMEERVWRER